MKIEILHVPACPGLTAAHAEVERWLSAQGRKAQILEVVIATPAEAERWQFRGSPTIRIDGRNVGGAEDARSRGIHCRLAPQEIPHGEA
ncbi:MAG: hypothetical protein ACRD04_03965 [Terriglobales bacterium]